MEVRLDFLIDGKANYKKVLKVAFLAPVLETHDCKSIRLDMQVFLDLHIFIGFAIVLGFLTNANLNV